MAQKSKERQNKSWETFAYASDSDENDELEKPVLKKFKKVYNSKFEKLYDNSKILKIKLLSKITGCPK